MVISLEEVMDNLKELVKRLQEGWSYTLSSLDKIYLERFREAYLETHSLEELTHKFPDVAQEDFVFLIGFVQFYQLP